MKMAANKSLLKEAVEFYRDNLRTGISSDTPVEILKKIVELEELAASLNKSE
jgi:hypothetical protein